MNEMASTDLNALQNRLRNAERQGRLRTRLGSAALAAALLVVAAPQAVSQGIAKGSDVGIKPRPVPTVNQLQADIEALRAELAAERLARANADSNEAIARANGISAEATLRTNAVNAEANTRASADTVLQTSVSGVSSKLLALDDRTLDVEKKTEFIKVINGDTVFTNTNLVLDGGLGKGNLLLGSRFGTPSIQGSGNLVIGTGQNISNHSSSISGSGNLVIGDGNEVNASGNLVVGRDNRAYGNYGVAFGLNNTVGELLSSNTNSDFSVAFGASNKASGFASFVGGGQYNTASGEYSVVSGGLELTATGQYDWKGPIQ